MSNYMDEEMELAAEEIGWRRPGSISVMSHRRGWPPSKAVPDPSGSWHQISAYTRKYPDVWDSKAEYKGTVGEEHVPRITKMRHFVKDGKVLVVAEVETPAGAKLLLGTSAPLPAEFGWNPFSKIKNAAKSIGKTAKRAGGALTKVVASPQFQQLAMAAAPMALSAMGVPPQVTSMAMSVVNKAAGGDQQAMDKVRNIANLSQQGYAPAMRLQQMMSAYYRGGPSMLPQMAQMTPQMMPQAPRMMPQMQQMMPQMPQMQQMMPYNMPRMPYAQMMPFRYNIPNQGRISGWVYNVPYRGISALLDSPWVKLRGLYSSGMNG